MAEACKKLKWHISAISQVKEGSFFRFDATSGDILYEKSFKVSEYAPNYGGGGYAGREAWQGGSSSTYTEKNAFKAKRQLAILWKINPSL